MTLCIKKQQYTAHDCGIKLGVVCFLNKEEYTMPDQITVAEFVAETNEDYKSPTASNFTTRMVHCRNTVTALEEVSSSGYTPSHTRTHTQRVYPGLFTHFHNFSVNKVRLVLSLPSW